MSGRYVPMDPLMLRATALLGLMFVAFGCATGSGAGGASTGDVFGDVVVGKPLPELALRDLQGRAAGVGSYHGKVVLLDVWASWCEPCKDELPALDAMAADLRAQGVEILAVSVDQDVANVQRFLRKRPHWSLHVFHDPAGQIAERLQPPKMPTSYVLDRTGVVRQVNLGFAHGDAALIRARLSELAAGG